MTFLLYLYFYIVKLLYWDQFKVKNLSKLKLFGFRIEKPLVSHPEFPDEN